MEAEAAEIAERAQPAAAVGGGDGLRGVLHHAQPAPARDREQRIHLRAHPGVMHGHNRPRARRDRGFHTGFVQVQRVLTDVHEHRFRPAEDKRSGGGDEGEGRRDDLVPGFDSTQHRGHLQRGRAARGQQDLARTELPLHPLLAAARIPAAARKLAGIHRVGDVGEFVADEERAVEGNEAGHGRECCRARPRIASGLALGPELKNRRGPQSGRENATASGG